MSFTEIEQRGIVLLGCGKMGSALLAGWLKKGISPSAVTVIDPYPSDWLKSLPVHLDSEPIERRPAVCLLAVKPQVALQAMECVSDYGGGETLIVSIMAGLPISVFETVFGPSTPIVRTMPNTPAAIGHGITALAGNQDVAGADLALAEQLMSAVGETVRLETESLMDAVTALSGSGPAYVFHMVEAMTEAGKAMGLGEAVSSRLAIATVAGAGRLLVESDESPEQLRINVTSPAGTTEAALKQLMDSENGLGQLMERSILAAEARSRELGMQNG